LPTQQQGLGSEKYVSLEKWFHEKIMKNTDLAHGVANLCHFRQATLQLHGVLIPAAAHDGEVVNLQ
jgi:hypothetical protein